MAYQHHIDPGARLATVTFQGPLDGAEIATATEQLYDHPAWAYGFDVVWDFRMISGLHLNVGHFPALVDLDHRFADVSGPGLDLIITGKDIHHGLARLYAHLARNGPRTPIACRSREDAESTLRRNRVGAAQPARVGEAA